MPVNNEKNAKKTIKVCMLSGKGGCGKTTTSLVLAKLLTSCQKKVLVIDCDLVTQGASCFFHKTISNSETKYADIACIDRILSQPNSSDENYTLIGTKEDKTSKIMLILGIYFIPYDIDQEIDKPIVPYTETLNNIVCKYLEGVYDVIIFDCQAGYNSFCIEIAKMCDKIIFVNADDLSGETANELLKIRLTPALTGKQKYVIRNKWLNSREKRHRIYNELIQYTAPIMFCRYIGRRFSAKQFDSLDFRGKTTLPLKYLLDILRTALLCFNEYNDSLAQIQKNLRKKYMLRILLLIFIVAVIYGTSLLMPFLFNTNL